jgi:hypothetical protein
MPDIHFHCKHCKGKLVVDQRAMGRDVACPECGEVVTIPLRSEDPVEAPKSSSAQAQTAAGTSGDICSRCGKKTITDKNEVAAKCREEGIPINWGALTPTMSLESDTATGLNEIFEIINRAASQKLEALQSLVGSWAPSGRCPTCGELWCQSCIMGPLPYNSMSRKPHCKCG